MLSKAVIACWCLKGSAQISYFYAFSKDPSSSSGRLFLSLFFVSFSCHWMSSSAHPTLQLLFVPSKITHSWLFCSVFLKSTFTRRSWPSVPLHGRIQRREVGCHYSYRCNCGWDSVLDDIKFIPHCIAGGQLLACGTSLHVPTQGRHCAVDTGLCSTEGVAPQTVFSIKDKYILVETLSGRILPGVSFFFFPPVFVHLREKGFHSFSLVFSSTGFSTLIIER